MKSRVRRKVAFAAVAVTSIGATFLIGGASAVSAATNSGTVALSASRPAFLAHATDLGPAAANQAVDFEILLAYPHESAVAAEAAGRLVAGQPSVPPLPHHRAVRGALLAVSGRCGVRGVMGTQERALGGFGGDEPALRGSQRNDEAGRKARRYPP